MATFPDREYAINPVPSRITSRLMIKVISRTNKGFKECRIQVIRKNKQNMDNLKWCINFLLLGIVLMENIDPDFVPVFHHSSVYAG